MHAFQTNSHRIAPESVKVVQVDSELYAPFFFFFFFFFFLVMNELVATSFVGWGSNRTVIYVCTLRAWKGGKPLRCLISIYTRVILS